jgi:PIN domain nuclease of toxin-antitoxin system
MRLLLDSHAFLWWCDGDERLSQKVRILIESETVEILVSAASIWEIATKARIGKLPKAAPIAHRLPEVVREQGFLPLPVSIEHAHRAGWLTAAHRDPFDRMLAAQSAIEDIPVATNDAAIGACGAKSVW